VSTVLQSVPRVDVLIAGAGPAGAAAAIALRQRGRSVHLVDRAVDGGGHGATSETLWPAALALLERVGLRDAFLASQPAPCHGHWSAWGGGRAQERSTLTDPHGPGWFIHRPAFDAMLRREALRLGASGSSPARVVAGSIAREDDGGWMLQIEPPRPRPAQPADRPATAPGQAPGQPLRARFLLDAGGRAAPLARALGALRQNADRLAAVSLACRGRALAGAATHVETCAWGWWYAAPAAGGEAGAPDRIGLTLMTDADLVRRLVVGGHAGGSPDAAGLRMLFARSGMAERFVLEPDDDAAGAPQVCPAATGRTWPACGDGWATAGDAAWSLDPLSSRGLSAALLGGLHAAHAIDAALSGDDAFLASYESTLDQAWREHRRTQAAFYAMEQRFAEAPFWQRRRLGAGPVLDRREILDDRLRPKLPARVAAPSAG
jgi:flavin-dependent dehydrogenase